MLRIKWHGSNLKKKKNSKKDENVLLKKKKVFTLGNAIHDEKKLKSNFQF